MRVIMQFRFEGEAANEAIRAGSMGKSLDTMLDQLRPEAAYFYPSNGCRGGMVVFDLADPSRLPEISEPLFAMNARVEVSPVMTREDLGAGLTRLHR